MKFVLLKGVIKNEKKYQHKDATRPGCEAKKRKWTDGFVRQHIYPNDSVPSSLGRQLLTKKMMGDQEQFPPR